MEGVHQCCRCRGKIYSLLTAETTAQGPVCIVCRLRAGKTSTLDGHALEGSAARRETKTKAVKPPKPKHMQQMDLFTARSGKT